MQFFLSLSFIFQANTKEWKTQNVNGVKRCFSFVKILKNGGVLLKDTILLSKYEVVLCLIKNDYNGK